MSLKVLCGIASDIAESGYYSIMAEESTDVSNHVEQPPQSSYDMHSS